MEYGLIGEHLSHSFSKDIHEKFASYRYDLCELLPDKVEEFLRQRQFRGINVTIPYKEKVMAYLDWISSEAKEIGAVNTVVNRDGHLFGYNTDFFGLCALLDRNHFDLRGKNVLILGTGGTSDTAFAVAKHLGARSVIKVSRAPENCEISYEDAKNRTDTQILINTTPVEMYPQSDDQPIETDDFPQLEGVVDVIYNPLRTDLVLSAQERGIPAVGGLYMLVAQAVKAAELFCEHNYNSDVTEWVYREIVSEKENIVLIGMPGCGKSTVGRVLAQYIDREFVDLDDLITEKTKRTPNEIIRTDGEEFFREIETEALKEVSTRRGIVLATGGGTVTRYENIRFIRKNGKVIFLDRPIDEICPTKDRPLSQSRDALLALYQKRLPIYENACDIKVSSGKNAIETAGILLEKIR